MVAIMKFMPQWTVLAALIAEDRPPVLNAQCESRGESDALVDGLFVAFSSAEVGRIRQSSDLTDPPVAGV